MIGLFDGALGEARAAEVYHLAVLARFALERVGVQQTDCFPRGEDGRPVLRADEYRRLVRAGFVDGKRDWAGNPLVDATAVVLAIDDIWPSHRTDGIAFLYELLLYGAQGELRVKVTDPHQDRIDNMMPAPPPYIAGW